LRRRRKAISKLKVRKAAGMDGISMEAWKLAGVHLEKEVIELIKAVWRKGRIPKDWKTSVVVPLHKRGDKEVTGNYRGISLLCTAYKVYAEILRNRLEKEAEEKDMIPESQAGFRKGRSTMDNVFVLAHFMQREKRRGGEDGKLYIFFVDLKAVFDKVDRNKLWSEIRRKGFKEELVRRVEGIYEETWVHSADSTVE